MEQDKPTTTTTTKITVGTETSYWEQVLGQVYSAEEKGASGAKRSLIEAKKRVVVLGDRGCGKSTLFRRSFAAAAELAIPKGFSGASVPGSGSEKGCGFSYNLGYFGGFSGEEDLDSYLSSSNSNGSASDSNDDDDSEEYDDDSAFAGVFEIGSLEQAPTLLSHAVPNETVFRNTIFVIVVNPTCGRIATPAIASLDAWAAVLRKFVTEKGYLPRPGIDISIDAIRNNKAITTFAKFNKIQNFIFSRVVSSSISSSSSPASSADAASTAAAASSSSNSSNNNSNSNNSSNEGKPAGITVEELVSLSEIMSDNIGVPVVVSLSKVDSDAMLPQKGGLVVGGSAAEQEATFEFLGVVQDYLRLRCLAMGAALVFNSERKNRNVDLLYAYIGYLLFGLKVGYRPQLGAADSVFIPAGWDSKPKIAFEFESKKIPIDEPFDTVVREKFKRESVSINTVDNSRDIDEDDMLDARVQSDQEFLRLLKNRLESTPVYGADDASVEFSVPSVSPVSSSSVSPSLTTGLNFKSLRRKDTSATATPAATTPTNTTE